MQFKFRVLTAWPRPFTKSRRSSSFQASYNATVKLLTKELENLGARNVVIQIALDERDIRLDGLPRANARKPAHPGVIVSCDSKQGPLSFMCDAFFEWEDNLRGIAMTLERLRLVDLYGVTQSGEQYRGWAALPAAPEAAQTENFQNREDAARWIQTHFLCSLEALLRNAEIRKTAYQTLNRRFHPDVGGDPADFRRLQAAKKVLESPDDPH